MMKRILQKDEETLRHKSKPVPVRSIKTPQIRKILREMSEALERESDGVAIAAPQIGYNVRIFIISGKLFHPDFGKAKDMPKSDLPDAVFINPEIVKLSKQKEWTDEGCLSVRWLYGKTHRHKKATVNAYDENGKKFTRGASGILAQAFQHEIDHLDGILFIDHAKEITEHLPE